MRLVSTFARSTPTKLIKQDDGSFAPLLPVRPAAGAAATESEMINWPWQGKARSPSSRTVRWRHDPMPPRSIKISRPAPLRLSQQINPSSSLRPTRSPSYTVRHLVAKAAARRPPNPAPSWELQVGPKCGYGDSQTSGCSAGARQIEAHHQASPPEISGIPQAAIPNSHEHRPGPPSARSDMAGGNAGPHEARLSRIADFW